MLRMLAIGSAAWMAGCSSLRTAPAARADAAPKNVIVFIADGGGYSAHLATAMWEGKLPAWQARAWYQVSVATYALRRGPRPVAGLDLLAQDPNQVFDPAKAWDAKPMEGEASGYPFAFAGYRWLRATAPDSANTASAIFTGVTTYTGAINVDGAMQPVRTAAEVAKAAGKAVGVVSSVPFSHATPAAAGGAHNPSREDYHGIAAEMLSAGVCDFIGGAGHPGFDNDGMPREPKFEWMSEGAFASLRAGTWRDGAGRAWTMVDGTDAIRGLAEEELAGPVIALAPVGDTLQMERRSAGDPKATAPGADPLTPGLPALADLSLAGFNAVDDDPEGFLLMVEGGAVDWAMHGNQCGRMIEEMLEFHRAIEALLARLDAGTASPDPNDPSWENTLVLITADHDHLLVGPEGERVAFQPLVDRGRGNVPGHRWMGNGHSNRPVPLWAAGAGRSRIESIATLEDQTSVGGVPVGRGAYFHQSEIGKAICELLAGPSEVAHRAGAVPSP